MNALAANFSATASNVDGTIASYAWNFGDVATGSGQQASHVYAKAGTYRVRLTVRDNLGASTVVESDVTVSPSTVGDELVIDTFNRNLTGSWGSPDIGPDWTTVGAGSRFAVSGGTGTMNLALGGGVTARETVATQNSDCSSTTPPTNRSPAADSI